MGYFPRWTTRSEGIVAPDERLPWPHTVAMGVQHVVAMFGATVLAPLLMGFDPNVAILMSGIGTLIFFVVVGGRVPSYLGSSFAFIGVVIAATGYAGTGGNPNIGFALGGIIVCGAVYALIGLLVMAIGTRWIESLMPPLVTGAVVAVIGLNLAPIAVKGATATPFDAWVAILTIVLVGGVAVFTRGMVQRLLILVGLALAYLAYLVLANVLGLGKAVSFAGVADAAWLGLPQFAAPRFRADAIALIAPVAIILVAENLGHVKAVAAMTGRDLDPYMGRAFLGDGVATVVAGYAGGTGVTTYAENIGVMAVTKIYSTLVFVVAAAHRDLARLQPEVRRADPDHPGPGARRGLDRGLRSHRGGGRQDLGRQQGGLLAQPQPDRGRGHAGAGRRRLRAQARRPSRWGASGPPPSGRSCSTCCCPAAIARRITSDSWHPLSHRRRGAARRPRPRPVHPERGSPPRRGPGCRTGAVRSPRPRARVRPAMPNALAGTGRNRGLRTRRGLSGPPRFAPGGRRTTACRRDLPGRGRGGPRAPGNARHGRLARRRPSAAARASGILQVRCAAIASGPVPPRLPTRRPVAQTRERGLRRRSRLPAQGPDAPPAQERPVVRRLCAARRGKRRRPSREFVARPSGALRRAEVRPARPREPGRARAPPSTPAWW